MRLLFSLVIFGFSVTAVSAQSVTPPPAPAWNGLYFGANAGGTWSERNLSTSAVNLFNNGFPGAIEAARVEAALANTVLPVGEPQFIGGGQFGYNHQFAGRFVAGFEADFQVVNGGSSKSLTTFGSTVINGPLKQIATASADVDYLFTLRGRLGVLWTPSLLAYATGGLAYGGVTAAATNYQVFYATPLPSGGIPHTGAGNISDRMTGWTAGGGLEWKLDARWSVKAEYLYYDLGSVDFSYVSAHILPNRAPFVTTGLTSSVRFDGHIVRAGLNFAL